MVGVYDEKGNWTDEGRTVLGMASRSLKPIFKKAEKMGLSPESIFYIISNEASMNVLRYQARIRWNIKEESESQEE